MKVSNVNVTRIYQDQVKKAQTAKPDGEFNKMMQNSTGKVDTATRTFHPPSGVNLNNPVITGAPVAQADPVETIKFAAEVFASVPDVRSERVDRIKALIDAGQYNVPADKVAEKLYSHPHMQRVWED
ncbi:MAG TPA: flagellar biosynthesis anti-sigma factor FlgM [Candidatus Rifleibacterium sp.]|nr:flagellar biosynthesis anti-sigma factor FlgM [Candidatus Rifleibacterium sp.]HPT45430.1 flagellar biosynthesis anti-sigma factor FlgM [Candidatus Rifleibacterium sp.]